MNRSRVCKDAKRLEGLKPTLSESTWEKLAKIVMLYPLLSSSKKCVAALPVIPADQLTQEVANDNEEASETAVDVN